MNKIEQELINTKLLFKHDGFISSERVLNNKKERERISNLRSKAGKKSAMLRLKATSVEQNLTSVEQGKERKGKESKVNNNTNTNTIDRNFDLFWSTYPKKVGKKNCQKIWKRLKVDEKEKIIKALPAHVNCDKWQDDNGRFIPNPATWLNQGRWDDEINEQPKVYFDNIKK